jgi:hypothetical protein
MFKGQPPANGSQFGLHGESEADRQNAWSFANVKITDLQPTQQPTQPPMLGK